MAEHGPNKSQHFGYERDIAPLRLTVYRMAAMVRYWSTFLYLTFSLLDATVGPEMKRTTRSIRAGRSLVDSGTTDGAVAALPPPPPPHEPLPPYRHPQRLLHQSNGHYVSIFYLNFDHLIIFFLLRFLLFIRERATGSGLGCRSTTGGTRLYIPIPSFFSVTYFRCHRRCGRRNKDGSRTIPAASLTSSVSALRRIPFSRNDERHFALWRMRKKSFSRQHGDHRRRTMV